MIISIVIFTVIIIANNVLQGLHLRTESTVNLATTQTSLKSCNENLGIIAAGVTSVAALYFIISVIIIITLAVAIKRLK